MDTHTHTHTHTHIHRLGLLGGRGRDGNGCELLPSLNRLQGELLNLGFISEPQIQLIPQRLALIHARHVRVEGAHVRTAAAVGRDDSVVSGHVVCQATRAVEAPRLEVDAAVLVKGADGAVGCLRCGHGNGDGRQLVFI